MAQRAAIGDDGDLAGFRQRVIGGELAALPFEGRGIIAVGIDTHARRGIGAVHAQHQPGADRRGHRPCGGAAQIDRRLARIGRRIDPGIERRRRARRFETGQEGCGQPPVPVMARNGEAGDEGQKHGEAQGMGVALRQAGRGQGHTQLADTGQQLPDMGAPQGFGPGIALAGRQHIVAFGDGAVGQCGIAFEPPCGFAPIRQPERCEVAIEQEARAADRRKEHKQMQPGRNMGEEVKQRRGQEQAGNAAGWPQSGPDAFPDEGRARERDEPLDAVSLPARSGGGPVRQAHPHSSAAARCSTARP